MDCYLNGSFPKENAAGKFTTLGD
ncbi:Uncharacterized protein APZ42_013430 [Daphnia magna]|uniref:Uncharacterized protein n=1 Tax=Daphnia magna TaxID=35525 RepID=A0A162QZW9_9CRUS|nr:Uncharacterized protein APZ42_013430 [Daphnia magna]